MYRSNKQRILNPDTPKYLVLYPPSTCQKIDGQTSSRKGHPSRMDGAEKNYQRQFSKTQNHSQIAERNCFAHGGCPANCQGGIEGGCRPCNDSSTGSPEEEIESLPRFSFVSSSYPLPIATPALTSAPSPLQAPMRPPLHSSHKWEDVQKFYGMAGQQEHSPLQEAPKSQLPVLEHRFGFIWGIGTIPPRDFAQVADLYPSSTVLQ